MLSALKRIATAGHAIAALVLFVVVYNLWGRVFEPGGTGSNVVLGLLVALAAVYLGATNLGPLVDDLLKPARKRERRILRQARDTDHEITQLLERAKKGKEKKLKDPAAQAALAEAFAAFHKAFVDADTAKRANAEQLSAVETKEGELGKALEKHIGATTSTAQVMAQARSLGIAFAVAVALRLFLVAPFQIPSGSMIPTLLIGDHLFVFRAMYGLQSPVGSAHVDEFATPAYLVRWSIPKVGDVVVFEAPPWVCPPEGYELGDGGKLKTVRPGCNAGDDWIKRVIALPGQRVKRINQTVYVDDKPYTLGGDGKMMRYMDFDEMVAGHGRWREQTATYYSEDAAGVVHDSFTNVAPTTGDWPSPGEPLAQQHGLDCAPKGNPTECTVKDGFVFLMGDNRDHSLDGRMWGAVPINNIKGKALFIWVSVDGSEESVHLGKFTLPRFRWDRLFQWIK